MTREKSVFDNSQPRQSRKQNNKTNRKKTRVS